MPDLESMPPINPDDQGSKGSSNQSPHKEIIESNSGWRGFNKVAKLKEREQHLKGQVTSILDNLDLKGIDGKGFNPENEIPEKDSQEGLNSYEQQKKQVVDFSSEFSETEVEVYYHNTPPSIITDENLLAGVAQRVLQLKGGEWLVKWDETRPSYDSLEIKRNFPSMEFIVQSNELSIKDNQSSTVAGVRIGNRRDGVMDVTLTSESHTINAVYDPILGIWKEFNLTVFYYDLPDELGGESENYDTGKNPENIALKENIANGNLWEIEDSEILPALTIGQLYNDKTNTWSTRLVLSSGGFRREGVITKKIAVKLATKAQQDFPVWSEDIKKLIGIK